MELARFDEESLLRLRQALLAGEPVHMVAKGPLPQGLRIDEIAPLLDSVRTHDRRLLAAWEARRAPQARPVDLPAITVVIPTHRRVPVGLKALLAQEPRPRVLVVSNGDDGPLDAPGAEVLRLPWQGHGATRRAAMAHVDTPLVLFTVDDALPLGRGFLRVLAEALLAGGWDAVVARQLPWPDSDHVTAERIRRWTPSGQRVIEFPQADNVATLYRSEVLRRHPFADVPIAEDAWWSRGRRIAYAPMAPVVHGHPRSPRDLLARERAIHEQLVAMGRPPAVPSLGALVGALPAVVRPSIKGGGRELANQLAELTGQYLGGRKGRRQLR